MRGLPVALAVLLLGACSDDAGQVAEPADPAVSPGTATDGFTGARTDVSGLGCERDGATWRVSGTVTNPLGIPARYRIYTSFVDGDGTTRALRLTELPAVDPGSPRDWDDRADTDAAEIECVLRVERVPVD